MLQMKEPDDYVLSTGTAVSVREFCEKVFRRLDIEITWSGSGLSEVGRNQHGAEIIRIDPRYFRPSEVPFLLGDSSKARAELDWCPIYTLDTLIDEMIEFRLNALQHLG
jgi:GDPmannose 4,6-dehydratase